LNKNVQTMPHVSGERWVLGFCKHFGVASLGYIFGVAFLQYTQVLKEPWIYLNSRIMWGNALSNNMVPFVLP